MSDSNRMIEFDLTTESHVSFYNFFHGTCIFFPLLISSLRVRASEHNPHNHLPSNLGFTSRIYSWVQYSSPLLDITNKNFFSCSGASYFFSLLLASLGGRRGNFRNEKLSPSLGKPKKKLNPLPPKPGIEEVLSASIVDLGCKKLHVDTKERKNLLILALRPRFLTPSHLWFLTGQNHAMHVVLGFLTMISTHLCVLICIGLETQVSNYPKASFKLNYEHYNLNQHKSVYEHWAMGYIWPKRCCPSRTHVVLACEPYEHWAGVCIGAQAGCQALWAVWVIRNLATILKYQL
ncbi:hypothetical protein VNO77_24753 [Canavalia gladiata]|uniref:Uncharacterized protein n=1 Tax=Canavalia gladiata TaxID=3824 RepID=A0AAN9QGK2_CANGL